LKTVDIHTHLLNKDVKFDRLYDKLLLPFFAKKFGFDKKKLLANPYAEYTAALTRSVRESNHVDKIVLFGVDSRFDDSNNVTHNDITVCASNEDVYKLYKENKDIIIPFFSINPKRYNALDLIDSFHELGFKGAKFLQNYWGVDTREERYEAYFKKLAEKNIPLIIHIGSESSVHSFKEQESIEMLRRPLELGVTVICAHMALSYEPRHIFKALSKKEVNFNEEYFILLDMLKQYDNLYADISAILTPVRAKVLKHLSQQHDIKHKLLFGTDFPVPFSIVFNTYDIPLLKRFSINKEKNVFDRYSKAILEYFPEDHEIYINYQKIIKGTHND
jgi:predicted TIM-barrel fold metal-dependent hydrolase